MNVAISLWYDPTCADCAAECDRISRAAVRDMQVTKLILTAGHRHNHPHESDQRPALTRGKGAAAAAPPTNATANPDPPSGELFDAAQLNEATTGSLNGFDSQG